MAFVAPKIVLTPLLIASASLAGRRWGALASGLVVALPLTSGPIALFIALDLGPAAAAQAATGALVGAIAQVAFVAGYVAAGQRGGWLACLAVASVSFILVAAAVALVAPPEPLTLWVGSLISIGLGLALLHARRSDVALPGVRPGRWDIPARAVVATVLVLAISGAAPVIGGHAAGVIATYPVYISVLTTFAHRIGGPSQAAAVLQGLFLGLPGFATFFLVVATALPAWPIVAAFGAALAAAITMNAVALVLYLRIQGRRSA